MYAHWFAFIHSNPVPTHVCTRFNRAAGFYHDQQDPGILHFFGKSLVVNGKSLAKSRRRLDADNANRVQQLEDQLAAYEDKMADLEDTVRRLSQTVSSLLESKDE